MTREDLLTRSAERLLLAAEQHRDILKSGTEGGDVKDGTCFFRDCPRRRKLRKTLAEAVDILEQTRKAFKSKQLETLRKRLIRVLAEDA